MKKKLMDLMPETPFEGEPMAVNETETMREAPIILPVFTTSVPLDFPSEGNVCVQ